MLTLVRELLGRIRRLESRVRKVNTSQVRRRGIREEAQGIVDDYFRSARPSMLDAGVAVDEVEGCDDGMQELLEASHRLSAVATYKGLTKDLARELRRLEQVALLATTRTGRPREPRDERILSTLKSLVPSAALSYEQAIRDLEAGVRLSWRGPATDLREALRETLDHLAPDADVESEAGFKREPGTNGPTMKQKARHLLKRRGLPKSSSQAPETMIEAVEEAVASFVRSVYARSSVSTHTPTEKEEVLRVQDWVRVALCELLEIR